MTKSIYIEKEILSKRFIIAIIIIFGYLFKPDITGLVGLVGAVIGYYFGTHTEKSNTVQEIKND